MLGGLLVWACAMGTKNGAGTMCTASASGTSALNFLSKDIDKPPDVSWLRSENERKRMLLSIQDKCDLNQIRKQKLWRWLKMHIRPLGVQFAMPSWIMSALRGAVGAGRYL
jgi:hypothetical protein